MFYVAYRQRIVGDKAAYLPFIPTYCIMRSSNISGNGKGILRCQVIFQIRNIKNLRVVALKKQGYK